MASAVEVLRRKGRQVFSTTPESTVLEALRFMAEKNVGALVVLSEGRLTGMFSERDYARKIVLRGKFSHDTLVREIMTPNPIAIYPDADIEECMRLMTEYQVRHLPVLEGSAVVGVVSIGDVVKLIMETQKDLVAHLERYIVGR
jgi:CBS domain-containing protein